MKQNSGDIGVVIVCYNTPGIISNAVKSVCDYVDKVCVIDNSDKDNDCFGECDKLSKEIDNVSVRHTNKNIGHGPGLNMGIDQLNTEYIVCMDSDAVLLDPSVLDEMEDALQPGVYGCGRVLNLPNLKNLKYLWLPFCMFKKETFKKYSPFIHDGAPFLQTMRDIKGVLKIVQIFEFEKKIKHQGRATRKIAGDWRTWLRQ